MATQRQAATTFFELQHHARRNTGVLVFYFVVAVALIVTAINTVVYLAFAAGMRHHFTVQQWVHHPIAVWISLGVLALIAAGTVYTTLQLLGGGRALADMVGARPISSDTKDLSERRLMNVVEEMSIASGTPVPTVYVMDREAGINAFVAGYRPTETVLVVTKGALEALDRDELQGVIGHEYSHMLNGDMHINMRLMGILAGIVLIAQFGSLLMRSTLGGRGRNGGQAALIGLALFVIGYIGVFFGALIKAAVSRQRELLADASSVQFTRNPDGIAGALWKIKESSEGSLLASGRAHDVSHFCFGDSVTVAFSSLMATHPPLEQRIKLINPTYMTRMHAREIDKRTQERLAAQKPAPAAPEASAPSTAGGAGFIAAAATAAAAVSAAESVGRVTAAHVEYGKNLHKSFPKSLMDAVHDGVSARCAIYALLLAGTATASRAAAAAIIAKEEGPEAAQQAAALVADVTGLDRQVRLPLLNITLPALKQMKWEERAKLLTTAWDLIRADERYTIFEFAVYNFLREHLSEDAHQQARVKYYKYGPVLADIRLLLSVLARAGAADEKAAAAAYGQVMAQFDRNAGDILDPSECALTSLGDSLHRLNQLTPMLKKSVIQACADCIVQDGKVVPEEAELLQAVSLCLDSPIPPLTGS